MEPRLRPYHEVYGGEPGEKDPKLQVAHIHTDRKGNGLDEFSRKFLQAAREGVRVANTVVFPLEGGQVKIITGADVEPNHDLVAGVYATNYITIYEAPEVPNKPK